MGNEAPNTASCMLVPSDLYKAALIGDLERVQELVEQRWTDINIVFCNELYKLWTPLHAAAINGHIVVVRYLVAVSYTHLTLPTKRIV